MRRRLLIISLPLVAVLLLALMVPLLAAYASDRTQDQFVGHLGDVSRFSVLAEDAIESGDPTALEGELTRYTEVYGGSIIVTDANREVVASAGNAPGRPSTTPAVTRALTGAGAQPPETAWPWSGEWMLIGSPVGRDAQVLGAVVVSTPTESVRDDVAVGLGVLALLALATVLLTAYGIVQPLVGWVLRPVHALDRTAKELSSGDLGARASETGPTELRHLARSFNSMADSVEASQAQQRELVADAAHQLGNPLTALRLRAENLASSGVAHEEIEPVLEETDRLSSTVESLLRLSQVGAARVVPEALDVAALVRHRCEMWSPAFADLAVRSPESVRAMATPEVIDTALDALLDNAAKFAPGSPVRVTVTPAPATSRASASEVHISVVDGGPGLHPDDVAKVGSRFFRGRTHQNVPGTGLGLAIVRARLADCGGWIEVDSPEEGGLSVTFGLPAPGQDTEPRRSR